MQNNNFQTEAGRILAPYFEKRVESQITSKGIYPFPMCVLTARGIDVVKVKGIDVKAYEAFFRACSHPEVQAAMFGLDRHVTPEQQMELGSVLTCMLYERTNSAIALVQARDCFRFGIIPYQHRPRVVKPIRWDHPYWMQQMQKEMEAFIPNVIIGMKGQIHLHSLGTERIN